MTPQYLFYIIITILCVNFLKDQVLSFLNAQHFNDAFPEELNDVYEEKDYLKSQAYKKTNYKLSVLSSSFSIVVTVLFFFLNGFALLDAYVREWTSNEILQTLYFVGILIIGSSLLTSPFSYYKTFVIEEKFGFNKMTKTLFFTDLIKSGLLTVILGGGILALITYFYQQTGSSFWMYTWLLIALFSVVMNLFYTSLIVPLFNKQTLLEAGELKTALEKYSTENGFQLDNIFVIDGSKRSTKANAYFSGLGPKKRIVLYDTLLNDLNTEEIVAVFAHEVGHFKKKHILYNFFITTLLTGCTLYILSLLIANPILAASLKIDIPSFHIGLIVFSILYSPISEFTGLVMHSVSRKFEYQADNYAKTTSNPEALITSLKKLSKNSLSNLTPHKATVFMYYSHPTLKQRINNLRK